MCRKHLIGQSLTTLAFQIGSCRSSRSTWADSVNGKDAERIVFLQGHGNLYVPMSSTPRLSHEWLAERLHFLLAITWIVSGQSP